MSDEAAGRQTQSRHGGSQHGRPARRLVVPLPPSNGLALHGPFAVWRDGEAVGAVSLRCPHLGCLVRRDDTDGTLVCPCHGSRYDARGRLLRGPSQHDLTPLTLTRQPATETLSVELPG